MNNIDIINEAAFWILCVALAAPLLTAVLIHIWRHHTATPKREGACYASDFTYKPWPWKIHIVVVCISCTAWLWSPWVALIAVKTYKANWNAVNYMSRPDTVIPVPGKTINAGIPPVEKP